jgi:hypothetical protein
VIAACALAGCGAQPSRASPEHADVSFADAVRAEPPAPRVDVERVEPAVLYAPRDQMVLVLESAELIALDDASGTERWRVPAPGVQLDRAGLFVVATPNGGPLPIAITLVEPRAPERAVRCALPIDAPPAADRAWVDVFDHAGEVHALWRSYTFVPQMGQPGAAERAQVRAEAGRGCGVLAITVRQDTCEARPTTLDGVEPARCARDSSTATLFVPAAAASAVPGLGAHPIVLTIVAATETEPMHDVRRTRSFLRASGAASWERLFREDVSRPGPP